MTAVAATSTLIPTEPGTPFEGGFFAGRIRVGAAEYALIVAPKAEGELEGAWGKRGERVDGADNWNDGHANTLAMAAAGSKIAKQALALTINGFADWHIPSRDELELIYRHLKPTTDDNYTYRSGENPSALPPTHAYTETSPAQTSAEAFRNDGAEAMEEAWYWSSTQYSPYTAWYQYFDDGDQNNVGKDSEGRVRVVRKFLIN
ncbi:DUF1566 domain-containing protein [Jeongeupia sp. USM3]|uniref:Lcl domain-containing protein n=1 Tax=Jeongeupia sp. USM3 TaxID=1906741 RepID=UPI00089DEDBA|nr:DUF1566 domain-containing protein [Jeongeupia sp. USM3]AOY00130.1 DUF1566 domain-containing protein [Jeongeupia sp. USM3]